jgi:alkylation response protein AidB-like acyl-CoA dehydrogenase
VNFAETAEQQALRAAVADLAGRHGGTGGSAEDPHKLWREAAELGFVGVNISERYGGGGAGIYELALVEEELAAAGCSELMLVVTPAICGTIIARFGTEAQRRRWLPDIASGSAILSFAITEPDAGSNFHDLATTARRDGAQWVLSGRKIYISGVDRAEAVMIVARSEDARTGRLRPALFLVPTDAPGFEWRPIDMDLTVGDRQFMLFLDDVRVPDDALVGEQDAPLDQLFAGLNPERIMTAAVAVGTARYALDRAARYARERCVWGRPIGAHQGIAHPLAQIKIELEQARLMMQKAATLYDAGEDDAAGEAANMAKYAGAEVAARAVDQAVQTLGGNGFASEYGLARLLATTRAMRVAPVSREMVLNFVAQASLGLPKSY